MIDLPDTSLTAPEILRPTLIRRDEWLLDPRCLSSNGHGHFEASGDHYAQVISRKMNFSTRHSSWRYVAKIVRTLVVGSWRNLPVDTSPGCGKLVPQCGINGTRQQQIHNTPFRGDPGPVGLRRDRA